MFGPGMAPKEILSRLFDPFNLKISDLYLETRLWSPLICAEKALHGEMDMVFGVFIIILTLLVSFVYILFLALL